MSIHSLFAYFPRLSTETNIERVEKTNKNLQDFFFCCYCATPLRKIIKKTSSATELNSQRKKAIGDVETNNCKKKNSEPE